MNKLYITKVLPDGYGVGVMPEMEKPSMIDHYDHPNYTLVALTAIQRWDEHIASLPTFLIHPSLNPKEGGWIEQWREEYQYMDAMAAMTGNGVWLDCDEKYYKSRSAHNRRIVLLPLVEKKEIDWAKVIEKSVNIMQDYATLVAQDLVLKTTVRTTADILSAIPLPPPEGNTPASEQGGNRCLKMKNGGTQCNELCEGCWQLYCNPDSTFQSPPSLPEAEKANELVEALEKYGNHLPSCNINQDWLEADQAMADTPDKFRDEGYYEALQEIEQKKKTCTCGFQQAISNYKK